MDGLLFYAIAWFIWIYFFFFVNRDTAYRREILFTILLLIIVSPLYTKLGLFSVSGVLILFGSLFIYMLFYSRTMEMISSVATVLIVCIAQVSFFLLVSVHPGWMWFSDKVLQAVCLYIVLVLLIREPIMRLSVVVIGSSLSEFVINFLIYSMKYYQMSLHFTSLDTLAVVLFITFIHYRMFGFALSNAFKHA